MPSNIKNEGNIWDKLPGIIAQTICTFDSNQFFFTNIGDLWKLLYLISEECY